MSTPTHSPWASRLTLAAALFALPLVLFGGSITTIGAGMAVEGWLVAEGHFLVFFPVEEWFRDVGTFVEHTHRLWGVLVGLCCIGAVVAAWRAGAGVGAAAIALVAVCVQGTIGGMRVEENSPQLAFLHGVFGQLTFATLLACALVLSRRWREASTSRAVSPASGRAALALLLVIVGQVVLGAMYRHDLRPTPTDAAATKLMLHMVGAVGVLAAVVVAAKKLKAEGQAAAEAGAPLVRSAKRLHALFGVQLLLGLLAWIGYRPDAVAPLEWTLSVAHVLFGGLFLAQAVCAWLWCGRVAELRGAPGEAQGGVA